MKIAYTKALHEIMTDETVRPCSLTRSEIETAIAEISSQLKGPLSNTERLLLVADRHELRKALAAIPTAS